MSEPEGPESMPALFAMMCQRIAAVSRDKRMPEKKKAAVAALVKGTKEAKAKGEKN